jgi:hypothetical protein
MKSDVEAWSDVAFSLTALVGASRFANIKRDLMMLYNTAKDLLAEEVNQKTTVYPTNPRRCQPGLKRRKEL